MIRKLLYGLLIVSIIALPLLGACDGTETTATPTPTKTSAPTGTPTPTPEANWWDDFGEPQYGGILTVRNAFINGGSWDPTAGMMGGGGFAANVWLEGLAIPDWALDRDVWAYPCGFTPVEYLNGLVMESWEMPDSQTIVVHIREGIHWHDKPPVNGRELTADDLQYNYDRLLGTGSGYDMPNPMFAQQLDTIERVVATDTHTIEVRLKKPSGISIYQLLGTMLYFVPPEWVEQVNPTEWQNIIGSGAWVMSDFVEGTKMVFDRNPDYWGYDERYPDNQLPYADQLIQLAIPDSATALAAMRSGQIDMWTDMMGAATWAQGTTLVESDPDIQLAWVPNAAGSVFFRCDTEPFTDIRVRKALNMAIDRWSIIENYQHSVNYGQIVGLLSPVIEGWALPYDDWPAELQAEYEYNPDRAMELLEEAGFPNGFDTNVVASSVHDTQQIQIIKSMFADVGVEMDVQVMDNATYSSFTASGKQTQMVYSDGMAGLLWSPTTSLAYLVSSSIPQTNYTFNNDATYDALVDELYATTDPESLGKASQAAELYALQQHWFAPLVPRETPVLWQQWVKGYSGEVLTDSSWAGAVRARLWIDQSLK